MLFPSQILISYNEFCQAKGKSQIPCECFYCKLQFFRSKTQLRNNIKRGTNIYCSNKCSRKHNETRVIVKCSNCKKSFFLKAFYLKNKSHCCSRKCASEYSKRGVYINCDNCGCLVYKSPADYKKSSNKRFCSSSCNLIYQNTHKKYGIRRSKLELWIEKQLRTKYPFLQMEFNYKKVIGSELDIYFPTLNMAFELNGPIHYKPIFGKETLHRIQLNDENKIRKCNLANIDLHIMDCSLLKDFHENKTKPYLSYIEKQLDMKLT